jgi:O-Antigen ligase
MATIIRAAPPPPQPRAYAGTRSIGFSIILAVALGYAMLLPPQMNLSIGTTSLPPFRFILIPAIAFIVRELARGVIAFKWSDALILFAGFWVSLALFMTTDAGEAFTAAVAQTTDMAVAYFFGRVTIRSLRDLRTFLLLMAPGLFVVGISMVIESVTHKALIQPLFSAITGKSFHYNSSARLGLFRAPGPFPHPILAGMFMTSFLTLYLTAGLRGWPKFAGVVAAFCGFFSMSSAALLSITTALVLTTYNWLSERVANLSWRMFFAVSAIFIFFAEASGAGTYRLLIKYASLNSSSAYNRIRIWTYGSANVEKNPWFGIGYADWERPSWLSESVDNFWLLVAMRFGLIVPILMLFALFLAVLALMRRSIHANPIDRRSYRGIAMALAVFAFGGTSVALWGASMVWLFLLMGLGVSIGSSPVGLPLGSGRPAGLPVPRRPSIV